MIQPALLDAMVGTELFVVVSVCGILTAAWIYRDAKRRGSDQAVLWGACVGFLFLFYALPGVVGLFVYLALRDTLGESTGDATDARVSPEAKESD